MPTWVLATRNGKKAAELCALLSPYGLTILTLDEAGVIGEAEETGATFAENAYLKAQYAFEKSGLTAVADDSGLSVEALHGAPGIYSARYGAPGAVSDSDRNTYLLRTMADKENRRCAFICALCLVQAGQPPLYFEGRCDGELLYAPRGSHGFGYDPLFYLPDYRQTMAELPPETKNVISHRAAAMKKLMDYRKGQMGLL